MFEHKNPLICPGSNLITNLSFLLTSIFTDTSMASSAPLQEFITCSICLEVYNNPKSLTCRHVYCHDCIQQLKQGSQVQCPDCREISSSADVKKDFRTQSLIDDYNQQRNPLKAVSPRSVRLCDICQESGKLIKSFCKVCEEYLCKNCETFHRRSKATKDHKLIEFIQMMKEKQRDIEREIKKLQDKRTDIHKNCTSVDRFTSYLIESKGQLTREVNKCRNDIKRRVDEHHDGLIVQINATIDSLQEILKDTKTLFAKYDSKLEDKVSLLSDVSNGQDYSLMTDTLENLSQQIEKDLQQIVREVPNFESHMKCPISVLKGEDWSPQKSTKINVAEQTIEQIRELAHNSKVALIFYWKLFNFVIMFVFKVTPGFINFNSHFRI